MGDKVHDYLVDWVINYLKNRDLLVKRIETIEKDNSGFDVYVKFKDKEQFFIISPLMKEVDKALSKFDPDRHFGLVVLNTTGNFDALVKEWGKFVKFKHLSVYFVNPFSQLDKRWIIFPYTHNNICGEGALKKGLMAMFEMVEPVTESMIKDRFE